MHDQTSRHRTGAGDAYSWREGSTVAADRAHLGQAFPGTESTPGVCGGEPCIVRTRIPLWVLEQMRRQGVSEAEILGNYPTLRAEDLANAWAFVLAHRNEIDHQIRENEEV